jgi:hypothetical protein
LRNRSNFSRSEGEIYKGSNGSQTESTRSDVVQERRPRAVSEVLPPISLPPIFKAAEYSKMTGKSGRTMGTTCKSKAPFTGKSTGRLKVAELAGRKTMNNELNECRYLRTRNFED